MGRKRRKCKPVRQCRGLRQCKGLRQCRLHYHSWLWYSFPYNYILPLQGQTDRSFLRLLLRNNSRVPRTGEKYQEGKNCRRIFNDCRPDGKTFCRRGKIAKYSYSIVEGS
nr:MAG TPA: hypothetical protein [Caudoviricetes sp.]